MQWGSKTGLLNMALNINETYDAQYFKLTVIQILARIRLIKLMVKTCLIVGWSFIQAMA